MSRAAQDIADISCGNSVTAGLVKISMLELFGKTTYILRDENVMLITIINFPGLWQAQRQAE